MIFVTSACIQRASAVLVYCYKGMKIKSVVKKKYLLYSTYSSMAFMADLSTLILFIFKINQQIIFFLSKRQCRVLLTTEVAWKRL